MVEFILIGLAVVVPTISITVLFFMALIAAASGNADGEIWGREENNGYSGWREAVYLYFFNRAITFKIRAQRKAAEHKND